MRKSFFTALAVALVGAAIGVRADEEKVAVDQLPKAVAAAIQKRFPKAEVLGAGKETEDGKTVYEVTVKDNGAKTDVTVTPEGAITLIEKEVPVAGLPKAVTAGLMAKYAGAKLTLAEEVYQVKGGDEKLAYYEVVLTAGGKTVEVQVLADGTIQKTEEKKAADKD